MNTYMDTYLEIANINKRNERLSYYIKVESNLFPIRGHISYQFLHEHYGVLYSGKKKERLAAAEHLNYLCGLAEKNRLYFTIIEDDPSVFGRYIADNFEETVKRCGYASIEEYQCLANEVIEELYERPIYHYSQTIQDATNIKPVSELDTEKILTATDDLSERFRIEQVLGISNCIYATPTKGLENIYGDFCFEIDKSDYNVVHYHIGDVLDNAADKFIFAQKPFKRGEFNVFAHKFIPLKADLLEERAEAFTLYKAGFGYPVIEVMLNRN
jgi:hypothetical protein